VPESAHTESRRADSPLPALPADPPAAASEAARCSPAVAWLALLCLLLGWYLSISVPLAVYSRRLGFGQGVVQVVFWPVGWLHDHTPLRYPLRWWARMWDPAID